MKRSILVASSAGAILFAGCEPATAPVTLLPAYRAVSVDGVVLPVLVAQSPTTDVYLIGELLELDVPTDRAWRTIFVVRRDRVTGADIPDTPQQVQAYHTQRRGARVVLRPAAPCIAILDCSAPDTLFLNSETARLRPAAWGRRELRYAPAIAIFPSRTP